MQAADHFQSLVDDHRDRVYRFCFYYLGRGEDAEDVTQEVFIRLWNNLGKVTPGKIPAWLNRVTRNACVDLVRKRITHRNVIADSGEYDAAIDLSPDTAQDTLAQVASAESLHHLRSAINGLSDPYRTVVILREIEELPYNEIAEVLQMPLNTVKVYLHRGRRILREHLKEKVVHGDI